MVADTVSRTVRTVQRAAEPLPELDDRAFGAAFDRFADGQVVCLGEASHGTSEIFRARAAMTRGLIERHGFTMVAVEADWPDAAVVNRVVRGRTAPAEARKYGCLKPWKEAPELYGHIARREGHARCEAGIVQTLKDLFANEAADAPDDPDSFLDAAWFDVTSASAASDAPALAGGDETWPSGL